MLGGGVESHVQPLTNTLSLHITYRTYKAAVMIDTTPYGADKHECPLHTTYHCLVFHSPQRAPNNRQTTTNQSKFWGLFYSKFYTHLQPCSSGHSKRMRIRIFSPSTFLHFRPFYFLTILVSRYFSVSYLSTVIRSLAFARETVNPQWIRLVRPQVVNNIIGFCARCISRYWL